MFESVAVLTADLTDSGATLFKSLNGDLFWKPVSNISLNWLTLTEVFIMPSSK